MEKLPLLVAAVVLAIAGFFILKVIKNRGIKGALFGAPIERTLGEIPVQGLKFMRVVLRVHRLKASDPAKTVAIEITASKIRLWREEFAELQHDARHHVRYPGSATDPTARAGNFGISRHGGNRLWLKTKLNFWRKVLCEGN